MQDVQSTDPTRVNMYHIMHTVRAPPGMKIQIIVHDREWICLGKSTVDNEVGLNDLSDGPSFFLQAVVWIPGSYPEIVRPHCTQVQGPPFRFVTTRRTNPPPCVCPPHQNHTRESLPGAPHSSSSSRTTVNANLGLHLLYLRHINKTTEQVCASLISPLFQGPPNEQANSRTQTTPARSWERRTRTPRPFNRGRRRGGYLYDSFRFFENVDNPAQPSGPTKSGNLRSFHVLILSQNGHYISGHICVRVRPLNAHYLVQLHLTKIWENARSVLRPPEDVCATTSTGGMIHKTWHRLASRSGFEQ